jgi:hypothetical protein
VFKVATNGYEVLPLETGLPQGEPGNIDTVLYSEPQLVKRGSYVDGQLAADERAQNTAEVVHWNN